MDLAAKALTIIKKMNLFSTLQILIIHNAFSYREQVYFWREIPNNFLTR
jgi:hypothetical protein